MQVDRFSYAHNGIKMASNPRRITSHPQDMRSSVKTSLEHDAMVSMGRLFLAWMFLTACAVDTRTSSGLPNRVGGPINDVEFDQLLASPASWSGKRIQTSAFATLSDLGSGPYLELYIGDAGSDDDPARFRCRNPMAGDVVVQIAESEVKSMSARFRDLEELGLHRVGTTAQLVEIEGLFLGLGDVLRLGGVQQEYAFGIRDAVVVSVQEVYCRFGQ